MHIAKKITTNKSRIFLPIFILAFFQTTFTFSQVIINEVNYRSVEGGKYTEYIELYNTSQSAQNLSDWLLEDAVTFQFPAGSTIAGESYALIVNNITDFNNEFTVSSGAPIYGNWTGALKNAGDNIILRNAAFEIQDKVDYNNWNEWPSTGHDDTNILSLQKINTSLPGNHGGSWRAANHTPGSFNGLVYQNNPNLIPVIKDVRKSPDKPLSSEDVVIAVEFDSDNLLTINNLSVILEYQKVDPGSYVRKGSSAYNNNWIPITMRDNGVLPDVNANNGVYTAEIESSSHVHRGLIRYRIQITTSNGFSQTLPDQNYRESNYGYYVYDGYPAHNGYNLSTLPELQDLTLLTTQSHARIYVGDEAGNETNNSANQYDGYEYLGEGTIVYNGKVYDHINFRPRGGKSRPRRDKPNLKFDLNREHSFETQNDCGQTYDIDRGKLILSGGWVNDEGAHGLTESIIYKILTLTGSIERAVNYSQFRIVDEVQETGNGGDFWGLYLMLEDYSGDLLDEHKLDEGNFWASDRDTRERELDYQGDFPNSGSTPTYAPWDQGSGGWDIGTNGDVEMFLADRIANVIYGQHGNNYIGKHSYKEYYNSVTGAYLGWWGDMDNSFGAAGDHVDECGGNGPGGGNSCEDLEVFDRNICNSQRHIDNNMRVTTTHEIQYRNMMRSVYDLLINGDHDNSSSVDPWEQIDFLVDSQAEKIYVPGGANDWMEVDRSRWNQNYDLGSSDNHVNWYKTWFHERANYMENNSSGSYDPANDSDPNNEVPVDIDIDDDINDPQIPNTPTIWKIGAGFPVDQLTFGNSSFSDLGGGFSALEWRIAEWSDPSNPFYDSTCKSHYEIEPVWESGEIPSNMTAYTIPGITIKSGRTYKVRMRHKDNTGRWSHWSDAVKFIAEEAITPPDDELVISEIHYNPLVDCAEFIEIVNNGNSAINLEGYRFDNGVDFTFPDITIFPNQYMVVADNLDCYERLYPSAPSPIGKYSGALSNSGEVVELDNAFGGLLDSVKFNDKLPWDTIAHDGYYSLAVRDLDLDNSFAGNWFVQCVFTTPGQTNNFVGCNFETEDMSNLVINEIAFKPANENLEFVEVKNNGPFPVNIYGATFSDGIEVRVDAYHIVEPNDFFIIARDTAAFRSNFQIEAHAQYTGNLSNFGERIVLSDFFGELVDEVSYDEGIPWDPDPANTGVSLALIDDDFDNDTPVNWSNQDVAFSPMQENTFGGISFQNYSGIEINEIHYYPDVSSAFEFLEIRNTSSIVKFLTDISIEGVNFTFADDDILLPFGYFVIANDYSSFVSEYGFAPDAAWNGAGSLKNNGEPLKLLDLFGNIIDEVTYSSVSPWDPTAANQQNSLALKLGGLDNSLPSSWSSQLHNYTPKAINVFDSDGDGVEDGEDQCPNFDNSLIGTSCNDGDPCTTGEIYNNNCICSGGTFQDSDNDGVCNFNDQCPGTDDNLIGMSCDDENPCTIGETYNSSCNCTGGVFLDSDNDGVCDANDICPGGDDNLDANNNGEPDACEACPDFITENNQGTITTNKSANINIKTDGWVPTGANVTYKAGVDIDLDQNFEVKLGAIFVAIIDACN